MRLRSLVGLPSFARSEARVEAGSVREAPSAAPSPPPSRPIALRPNLSQGTGSTLGALLGRVRPAVAGALLAATMLPGCSVLGPGAPLDETMIAAPLPASTMERLSTQVSPLFAKIVADARRGADLVPADVAVTFDNRADPTVAIESKRIWETAAGLIVRAEREIVLQTFAFDVGSDPARLVFDALAAKARAHAREHPGAPPITVRILVDAMALGINGNLPTEQLLASIAARIDALGIDHAHLAFELLAYEHALVGSSHAKLVGVDGEVFLVTGANLAPANAFEGGEHDAAFVVEGDVAKALRASFEALRTSPSTKRATLGVVGASAPAGAPQGILPQGSARHGTAAPSPMAVFAKPPNDHIFSRHERYTLDHALVAAFRGATEGIDLETPNLNAATLKREVLDAVARGETVRLVLSKHYEDRSEWAPGQGGTNQVTVDALYEALADRGLSIDEQCARLQVRWYSHDGRAPVEGHDAHASHVKLYAFRGDGGDLVVFVGSLNLDTQSWKHSGEVLVAIDDDTVARAWLDQLFERDFARSVPVEQCDGVTRRAR